MHPSQEQALLTIGELAARTGVAPATLRMWESRHGFPAPQRLQSGHRRYLAETVEEVEAVLARQRSGVRLEAAIAQAGNPAMPRSLSVYAELRRTNPELTPLVLRKTTLVAVSHAIEDEWVARAQRGILFGAFQRPRHLKASWARWQDLARTAQATHVFTVGSPDRPPTDTAISHVTLREDASMRREWSIVCDPAGQPDAHAVALSAWELPGQNGVPDGRRQFETIWTLNPSAVREAALTCAEVAADANVTTARDLLADLEPPGSQPSGDPDAASRLFLRVVKYAEQRLID